MNRKFSGPRSGEILPRRKALRYSWPIGLVAAAWLLMDVAVAQNGSRPAAPAPAARPKPASGPALGDGVSRDGGGQDAGDQPPAERIASKQTDQKPETKEPAPATLVDLIKYAAASQEAANQVKDFTATFTKTELVQGRLISQSMDMKFRAKPFSVYMRYRTGPEAGRQAIYVDGKFGGNLMLKETGVKAIAGAIPLRPDSALVMKENRYPVTEVGIANMINTAMKNWERDSKLEAAQADVKFFPNAKLGELPCEAIQLTHLKPHRDIKYHLTRIYFDKETKLPLRAECYGFPRKPGDKAPLIEDYRYSNLKTNVKLTDADFNPAAYGF